jgi:hypothetical protein
MNNNLFSNPAIDSALKALTPEQRKEYEAIGKYMFSTDFSGAGTKVVKPEEEIQEAVLYITELLKSGYHPDDLSDKELLIMKGAKGDSWMVEFGYTKDELRGGR